MNIASYNGVVPGNIVRIINERGYKQGAIARKAGLNEHQLTDMVRGRKIIKVSDIIALADALDVPIPDFFAVDPPSASPPA